MHPKQNCAYAATKFIVFRWSGGKNRARRAKRKATCGTIVGHLSRCVLVRRKLPPPPNPSRRRVVKPASGQSPSGTPHPLAVRQTPSFALSARIGSLRSCPPEAAMAGRTPGRRVRTYGHQPPPARTVGPPQSTESTLPNPNPTPCHRGHIFCPLRMVRPLAEWPWPKYVAVHADSEPAELRAKT
jgi:hypothetical protein